MEKLGPFILVLLFISGCDLNFKSGNGNMDEIYKDLSAFEDIYIGGNFDVSLIPSDENSILIRGDENLLKYINVEIHNNSLNVNTIHNLKSSKGINIIIKYTSISGIYSTGASKITHNNILKTQDIQVDLSGTGSIELDIEADNSTVTMTGAGLVKLKGKTSFLEANISGAGGLVASELIARDCDISLSGVGGAKIYVTDKLEASISGVGGIQYSGNPSQIEKKITGFGKITHSEE